MKYDIVQSRSVDYMELLNIVAERLKRLELFRIKIAVTILLCA